MRQDTGNVELDASWEL